MTKAKGRSTKPQPDAFTLQDIKEAVAVLEQNSVPPDEDGNYHFFTFRAQGVIPSTAPPSQCHTEEETVRGGAVGAQSEEHSQAQEEPDHEARRTDR